MSKTLLLFCLLLGVLGVTHFRLNTNQQTQLNVGDSLISTMGLFKATLLQNQCVLSIQKFDGNNAYSKMGNYSSPGFSGNCNSLSISEGRVATDNNSTYMTVGSSFNISTILTIDDWGIIRLIGTYQLPDFRNQESLELNVTDFTTTHTLFYPASQKSVSFTDKFGPIVNDGSWEFATFLGQFEITQINDAGLYVGYSYSSFTLNNSWIYDFPGNTFPATIFPNISFPPRCVEPRLYITFKPPYVLVLDPFWPIASVYEQGRYKIAEVSYASVYQPQAWQNQRRLHFRNEHSVCPPYTFKLKGNCVPNCPYPYYHQMRGVNGDCVLTCEEYSPQNETTRVCSCYTTYEEPTISSETIKSCPTNAVQYPYGCYCNQTGLYFDRTLSFSCVATCPNKTFNSSGLCMDCPARCLSCQIDKLYRTYLECMVCEAGFNVIRGQCYKTCSPGQGNSEVNGNCQSCTDPNCLDCSSNVGTCKQCSLLYAASNGACVQTCLNTSKMAFADNLNSVCLVQDSSCSSSLPSSYKGQAMLKCITCVRNTYLHGNTCTTQCPTNFTANANNHCMCSDSGTLTVDDQCLAIPVCPIKMGWDSYSSSCLRCQAGCLTCYDNGCTSCYPGYFLYVSPQGVFCRKKSPLYTCDQQYGWINGICLLREYSNSTFRLTRCLAAIANCDACFPSSDTMCASCKTGFFNVNNTCISTCPADTIEFEGITCIFPEVTNCSIPYLKLDYQAVVINYVRIQNSDPYSHYTFNGKATSNDPVGYIPIFQQLTERKDDGLFRDTEFISPSWTCLKCADGLGLSSDFLSCVPCPAACLTCYMALDTSCLTVFNPDCQYYIDSQTSLCIKNCSSDTSVPQMKGGVLYCYPVTKAPGATLANIDSSTYTAADGTTFVFFVLDSSIKSNSTSSVTLPVSRETTQPRVTGNGQQRVGASVQNAPVQNGYLYLKDANPLNSLWILNATGNVNKLASGSNVALSNTIYGVSSTKGHSTFMKTWLAYIGYIMGPVLICLHAVYIGNDLLYKVDNSLILAQTIYFFSFVQLLVGQLMSQLYYGWLFAMFGFFPNFFSSLIPSSYVELAAPNSYKLATMDANIVRNAGWAFSLFLVFLGGWLLIALICYLMKKVCRREDIWHPRIAVNSLIAGWQFVCFPIFYWAVANLMHIGNSETTDADFNRASKVVSAVFIGFIAIYGIVRWFFNVLGGLYMFKRMVLATILAGTYLDHWMLIPLIGMELVFIILRLVIEAPEKRAYTGMIWVEAALHIVVYVLGYIVLNVAVNAIIMSIIIFLTIVVLSYGLTDLYLESRNQWEQEEKVDGSGEDMVAAEPENDGNND